MAMPGYAVVLPMSVRFVPFTCCWHTLQHLYTTIFMYHIYVYLLNMLSVSVLSSVPRRVMSTQSGVGNIATQRRPSLHVIPSHNKVRIFLLAFLLPNAVCKVARRPWRPRLWALENLYWILPLKAHMSNHVLVTKCLIVTGASSRYALIILSVPPVFVIQYTYRNLIKTLLGRLISLNIERLCRRISFPTYRVVLRHWHSRQESGMLLGVRSVDYTFQYYIRNVLRNKPFRLMSLTVVEM
jgi:hypothetical protein